MIAKDIELCVGRSTSVDIHEHLMRCDLLFVPKLSSFVELAPYALRLHANAMCFEAWAAHRLVGLLAIYANRPDKAFISNLSVEQRYQGAGVAYHLLRRALDQVAEMGFRTVELEVDIRNSVALDFYVRNGFLEISRSGERLTMLKNLH